MSQAGAWRLLAVFAALNVLSFVDRQLLAALAPLLIADLGLSRAQVGLLIGPAFLVVFALSTAALAALADRVSRTRLVAACVAVWSTATALTATATGFGALAACRALVGVGEAALSPAALAVITDAFPLARLGLASSIFYAGIPVGFAISFFVAGWLAPWLGWRTCFLALGLAGLAGAALVARIGDSPRHQNAGAAGADASLVREPPRGSAVARLRRVLARDPAIALLILGGSALGYASGSSQHAITWLVQERGFAFREAAWLSALFIATAGLSGNLAIGAVTDLARQRSARARLLVFVGLGLGGLALAAGFYTAGARSPLFFGCWFGAQAWLLGWYGPLLAAVQERAPSDSRATLVGFALMVVNLLGVALGPWITGVIGDSAGLTRGLLASLGVGASGLLLIVLASTREATATSPARSPTDTDSSHS